MATPSVPHDSPFSPITTLPSPWWHANLRQDQPFIFAIKRLENDRLQELEPSDTIDNVTAKITKTLLRLNPE